MYDDVCTRDTNAQFDIYCVGKPHPRREKLPHGTGMLAQHMRVGITMHVLLDKRTGTDVQAFQVGERKFGLLPRRGGYIWLLRDGLATWHAPYSPIIEPPESQALPSAVEALGPQSHVTIKLILTDDRRIVRPLRLQPSLPTSRAGSMSSTPAPWLRHRPVTRPGARKWTATFCPIPIRGRHSGTPQPPARAVPDRLR